MSSVNKLLADLAAAGVTVEWDPEHHWVSFGPPKHLRDEIRRLGRELSEEVYRRYCQAKSIPYLPPEKQQEKLPL